MASANSVIGRLGSSVGRKLIMGFSGLGLVVFIIMHLLGNLLLLSSDPLPFNTYAYKLHQLGALLEILEWGLAAIFVIHIISGIMVSRANRAARPVAYGKQGNAGGNSQKTLASVNMFYTGLLLLAFLIWHLVTFTWGPGQSEGYVTTVAGQPARDLYRLVSEVFAQPFYVVTYVAIMGFLGLHLRHGFWSAFQSLGLQHPRLSPLIRGVGIALALALAVGFMAIPVWVYARGFCV